MKYYLIAGEASGDIHGANLMKKLLTLDPLAEFRFWGGDRMAKIGGTQVMHYRDTAYMGFAEVIKNLPTILSNLKLCEQDILQFQPDALILIDYPGFNIRIAKWARKVILAAKTIYYISPQIWAWKAGRAHVLKKVVDRMLVILPFESAFYARYNFPVEYVGHPLLDHLASMPKEVTLRDKYGLDSKPVIALLPGSRKQEVMQHLPEMVAVAPFFSDYQFVLAAVSTLPEATYDQAREKDIKVIVDDTSLVLSHCRAALVASGTATLETALMDVPQVVCYRGGWLNYVLAKKLIKVKYISLVNLILDQPLVKELIQNDLSTDGLVSELTYILSDSGTEHLHSGYAELRQELGGEGASLRAAQSIYSLLTS